MTVVGYARMDAATHVPTNEQESPPTVEAYNTLHANLTEAAKHSRNLFIAHVLVQAYALIVLAGLNDQLFFQQNSQQQLPVIDASVSLNWLLPALAFVSLLIFVYWQLYQRKMWLLANHVSAAAATHVHHPAFVPATGHYRYPWIAFFVTDNDTVLRLGAIAFGSQLRFGLLQGVPVADPDNSMPAA